MKLRNLSRWTLTEETASLLFFAQRIDELLFDLSLDTYKPPALNSPSLCLEAISLIKEIEKGTIEASNLQHVIEELVWSLQNDPVAKSLLDSEISYYTLHNDQTPISATKLRLEILSRTLNSARYIESTCEMLFDAITSNKKKSIDLHATALITSLVNNGVNKQWLHEQTHVFFFAPNGEKISSNDALAKFISIINQDTHHFCVYAAVSNLILQTKTSLGSFKISIVDLQDQNIKLNAELKQMLLETPAQANEVLVKIDGIECRDPYTARSVAFRRLDLLSDLLALFHHRKQITWSSSAVIEWACCAFAPARCDELRNPMEKAFDFREDRAAKELNQMIRNLALRQNPASFQRFNRVADLHGTCISQNISENQLVNLWTAIETLIPSHVDSGSKIKQVINAAIPFIGITYIKRIIDRLLFDLLMWDKWRTRRILNKINVEKGTPLIVRLSIFLFDPAAQDLRDQLYAKLGDFHLLRYRIFCISTELSNPINVKSRLDRHEKKVKWQMRRLYRARNLIVHTSQTPSYVGTLIENGHDYLDSIMFGVIKSSCSDYKISTIEQSFELTSVLYRKLISEISSCESFGEDRARILVSDPY